MASRPKKRKSTKRAAPLGREDLLPMTASIARSISLRNHMALAVLRRAQGNVDLAGELLKTLYWAFYLSTNNTLRERKADFIAAERGLKSSIIRGGSTGEWAISEADAPHIEVILQLHDKQLMSTPVYQLERGKQRLLMLMAKNEGLPSFDTEAEQPASENEMPSAPLDLQSICQT